MRVATEMLQTFVGPVGLYGDVNDILKENMQAYKLFCENVDVAALKEARVSDRESMSTHSDEFKAEFEVGPNLGSFPHCQLWVYKCM